MNQHIPQKPCETCGKPFEVEKTRGAEKRYCTVACRRKAGKKAEYGLPIQQYHDLVTRQAGVCAICGSEESTRKRGIDEPRALGVDHDHKTLHVRGLLCQKCNTLIAFAGDDPALLRKAAEYLEKYQT